MENKNINGRVRRGEIYLYDFGNNGGSIQNGVRPALVVQCDEGNAASSTTIIAANNFRYRITMKGTIYMDKDKIRQLADYAVRQCCDNSENCYWSVSYDELYHHFGAEVSDTNENGRLLEEELRQREEINELIMAEDAIEMTCHLQYCHNCQGNPVSLLSVLGCNIYDEHESEYNYESAHDSSDEDQTQEMSM